MMGFETPWWPEIRRECPPALSGHTKWGRPFSRAERWTHVETCLIYFLSDDPIHPVIESIVPASGIGVGLSGGWDVSHQADQANIAARALISNNLFWLTDVRYTIAPQWWHGTRTTPDRPQFELYGTLSEFPRLNDFGVGHFYQHEIVTGGTAGLPVTRWLRAGAVVEYRLPRVDLLGVTTHTSFAHYGASLELHDRSMPPDHATASVRYGVYQDLSGTHHTFGQLVTALAWTAPMTRSVQTDTADRPSMLDRVFCHEAKVRSCNYGAITLRGRVIVSHTFAGTSVPFYYQPTLGGTDINGFDTLRGFADYRFRGSNVWLGQAEYQRQVWGPLGLLLFYDVGKANLDLVAVHQDFGIGCTVTVVSHIVLRATVGFGGGEGVNRTAKLTQF